MTSGSARRVHHVAIPGPAGILEGVLQARGSAPQAISALVCHPHPLGGGTLHNKVVHRVANLFEAEGAMVLRFNFRGVGKSDGQFDEGRGELDDARAAHEWLKGRVPKARRWLAGFSFGSWIATRLAAGEAGIELLLLIAPPVARSNFGVLRSHSIPKLVVQGTADELCPRADLDAEFARWAEPKVLVEVPGASHFFHKQLSELASAVTSGLDRLGVRETRKTI